MEEIIEAFGVDIRLIIIQIINFTVLMSLLGYFLYKPILRVLAEREEKIAKGIKDAEAAAVAKAQADTEKQVVLSAAHQEASEINNRAKTAAEVKADEIVSAAESKAAALHLAAQEKAIETAARITKEAEAEIAKTAILAAEKVLREQAA